jgi:eukaryotic-like serine/threonine-protein kinase
MKDIDVSKTLTSPPPTSKWIAGQTLAGKYTILGELGKGGMGEVYLAEDTSLDRKVALKFLPETTYQNPAMRARFVREAKAAAALSHPYICNIHEVGEVEGKLFFAMEYVEGKTLRDRIHKGPLPSVQALQTAAEIAEALQVAHEKGLVHRDIKPANIMLTTEGHAKVMDFGLAKHFGRPEPDTTVGGPTATVSGEGLTPGTPAYMSPEQLRGKDLDPRSDIFSFGIVLYEMLSGRHPFKKETEITTASAILSEEPRPIIGVIEGIPEGLQRIIGRMLAKDPGERYASMAAVHADLKKVIADVQGAKSKPWFKPVRIALTAVVLAGAVLGAGWLAKTLFFKTPAKALAFQARDWILVTDFENKTGEPVFDGSLETALTVSIQQSQYVNVFPPARVQETLKRMRRADVKKIDEAIGREIAIREGIKGLLVCGIGKIGGDYLLTAKIVDPEKQTTVFSDSARTKKQDDILASVDDLAKKVRHGLGESMARITQQRLTLDRATTSSLEALKYLSAAKRAPAEMIIQLLNQALELDPDFALAHVELGVRYYINGNRVKGEEHFQKALSLLDRLTMREKLWIRALVEDWRGNRDLGIQNYKTYLAQYPDDNAAWFRLAYAYMVSNQYEQGIEAFKRVTEIDKGSANAYVNMATCYNSLRKNDEALAIYQKAFTLSPELATGTFINNEYGFMLVRMGKVLEAEQTFNTMIAQPENWKKAKGYRSLALLQMYQGKYAAAQESLREAISLDKSLNAPLSEFREHIFKAMAFLMKRENEAFGREMAAAERIRAGTKIEPFFMARFGTLYARAKRLAEADRVLESLRAVVGDVLAASGIARSNQSDQASFHRLKGEIELARGRYEDALSSFGMVTNLRQGQVEDGLALAYFESGNVEKAIEKYEAFIGEDALGGEAQDAWVLAHYRLGILLEKKGDRAEAAKYYGRFLELWKDADPDIAEVADAKKRLAALTPR